MSCRGQGATPGGARRFLAQQLTSPPPPPPSVSINWNGIKGSGAKANTASIELIPSSTGLLTCTDCYAYIEAAYSITFQFCIGVDEPAGTTWFFTSEDPDGSMGSGPWSSYPSWSASTTAVNMADCVASLAPWVAAGTGTPFSMPMYPNSVTAASATHVNSLRNKAVNMAFNVDAYVTGSAGFNFVLGSAGFTTAGKTSSCAFAATTTDSSTCLTTGTATTLFSITTPINIPIATGVTAAISGSVSAAVIYSGSITGAVSIGAGAYVTDAKLGGQVKITDFQAIASSCTTGAQACIDQLTASPNVMAAYTNFPLTYSGKPLTVKINQAAAAAVDATLFVNTVITLDNAIPITAVTATQFSASVALGTARRSLRFDYADEPRRLDSAATCPAATGTFFTAKNKALLSATAGPTTVVGLISGVAAAGGFTLPSLLTGVLPVANVIPLITVSASTANGAAQPLVEACLTLNKALAGTAGGAGSTAVTSAGGGGGSTAPGGGGGGSGSAPAAATTDNSGAVAGGVIGGLIALLLLGGGGYYYHFVHMKKSAKIIAAEPATRVTAAPQAAPAPAAPQAAPAAVQAVQPAHK